MNNTSKHNLKVLSLTLIFLVILNVIGNQFFHRFDLTKDKRYTLSPTSLQILKDVKNPLVVDVFLKGQFPGEFKKLQTETQQILEEFKAYNSNIVFRFVNILDDSEFNDNEKRQLIYNIFVMDNPDIPKETLAEVKNNIQSITDLNDALLKSFVKSGMSPANVTMNDHGKESQEMVFPWAIAKYSERSVKIPLLKNNSAASTADKVNSSVQQLEYAFANAFHSVTKNTKKRIIVLKGNDEIRDNQIFDFIKQCQQDYVVVPLAVDSLAKIPSKIASSTLTVIAKPKKAFTDQQKQLLDQYVMNGGKTFWMVDQVSIEMDSLTQNENGATLAFARDLNLNDLFFKYGFRINPTLIKDVLNAPLVLAVGNEGNTQYQPYPWYFSPLVYPNSQNPIVKNIDAVKMEYANSIDTLKNGVKKSILLTSSKYSKAIGAPVEVNLSMVEERPNPAEFAGSGNIPVAVLLEGEFHSVFENRVLPFASKTFKNKSVATKMIVVSDGDILKNDTDAEGRQKGILGYDTRLHKLYGNKEFVMNCVNYLMDDSGLINIRSKEVDLPLLDKEKVYENYTMTQLITVGLPIVILGIFGLLFTYLRKRKYAS